MSHTIQMQRQRGKTNRKPSQARMLNMVTSSDGEIHTHNRAVQTRQVLRRRAGKMTHLGFRGWRFLRSDA